MRLIRTLLMIAAILFVAPLAAQPCSGFTDVGIGSGFCPNVDWLKNRGITLGCTSTTLYCPNDPVSRLQMAAFLNRLGDALTPLVLRVEQSGAAVDLTSAPVVCQTANQAIDGFGRSFLAWGVVTAKGFPDADINVQVVRSSNGGMTWGALNQQSTILSLRSPVWNNATLLSSPQPDPAFDLTVGSSYMFGLQLSRTAGTPNLTAYSCHLLVELRSRTNGTFPY